MYIYICTQRLTPHIVVKPTLVHVEVHLKKFCAKKLISALRKIGIPLPSKIPQIVIYMQRSDVLKTRGTHSRLFQRQRRIQGAHPPPPPPLELEKIRFFGVKSWFFTRNTPKVFAPPFAQRNFLSAPPPPPPPPNLKCWIRPLKGSSWSWSYGSWIYNYLCNQCLSPLTLSIWIPLKRGVLDTTLYDKACQWLAAGRRFSLGTPVSTNNKTDRHDITETLLKVVLNTITLASNQNSSCTVDKPRSIFTP